MEFKSDEKRRSLALVRSSFGLDKVLSKEIICTAIEVYTKLLTDSIFTVESGNMRTDNSRDVVPLFNACNQICVKVPFCV